MNLQKDCSNTILCIYSRQTWLSFMCNTCQLLDSLQNAAPGKIPMEQQQVQHGVTKQVLVFDS